MDKDIKMKLLRCKDYGAHTSLHGLLEDIESYIEGLINERDSYKRLYEAIREREEDG